MKYQFYAIVYDVAGNQVSSKSAASPLSITTSIQYVTGLSISPNSAQTKNTGETFTVTPTVTPANANNKNVNWSSSNTSVATVSATSTASGTAVTVTCKAAGTATITATAADGSGKSASFTLTVYDKVTVTAFSYSTDKIDVNQVTAVPTKTITGTAKSGPTYSSSNTGVATVASDGKVTGKASGVVTITISYVNYDGSNSTRTYTILVFAPITGLVSASSFGNYVNYPVTLGTTSNTFSDGTTPKTDWRIFYKDSTYTYIIASDIISTSKFPSGIFTKNDGKYSGSCSDGLLASVSAATVSTTYTNIFLYTKLSTVATTNQNYKLTYRLLNTSSWTSMVNSTYADVAIGTPTFEMLCASWNTVYPEQLLYYGVNSTGYTVGHMGQPLSNNDVSVADRTGYSNSLYYPHKGIWNNSYGYWLSTPCAATSEAMWCMDGPLGSIDYVHMTSDNFKDNFGVRPVVRIKSTTKACKDANGIWQLKN